MRFYFFRQQEDGRAQPREGEQTARYLGQDHETTWQQRWREGKVQAQPPPSGHGTSCSCYALPISYLDQLYSGLI